METGRLLNVSLALEQSRTGQAGRIWMFFEQAIPASLARQFGSHLLTETMERRPAIGLDSYDGLFPNQDTLPHNSCGSPVPLPLEKQARACGNSVFLDDHLKPLADQWTFLGGIRKISRAEVEDRVRDAQRRDRIVGVRFPPAEEKGVAAWAVPPSRRHKAPPILGAPLPPTLELIVGNEISIARETVPAALHNRLLRLAAFQNPEFYKAQAMHLPTYGKPRIISCAVDRPQHISLPRGCLNDVCTLLSDLKVKPLIRDERCAGQVLEVVFQGQLRPEQKDAAEALLAHDTGVLSAATAFGKTVVAAWLIAQRRTNTLVLVHRQHLLEQWIKRLSTFLALPARAIGRIGGGRKKPTGALDVALIQSLARQSVVADQIKDYGHLIVDECHHLSAQSFEQVVRRSKARFVTGLSATLTRKDGRHPIIFMQCGPVRYCADAKKQAAGHPFAHKVLVRPTGFWPQRPAHADVRLQFHELYGELMADEARNQLICGEVVQAVREGRSPIVLTERQGHLDHLAGRLSPAIRHLIVLHGGMGRKERHTLTARLAAIPENEERALLATGQFLGEGFDDPRLDTLFLTLPVSWHGTIAQYVGRLHRVHEHKREVRVYDYADLNVPMLARMFDRRCRGYEALGYSIFLPASAVPGWPAEVPLPADPAWKKDYSASVRRLVRDGVDVPLAQLFVGAVTPPPPGAVGAGRARSATEAFLYRRLETIPQTAGRFQLNVALPIPFGGQGRMEVDLLCAEARLAIELDGPHHLADAQAYRLDRHKDHLLQEQGYFVLRFLAEDVGKYLDEVLDTIQRVLVHQLKDHNLSGRREPPTHA
jgi:superfamily II DNA or RNA helicase